MWVFNPMSIAVSTRGNADTIISCLVLLVLWLLLNKKFYLGGFFFGLVVHFKIYPILYALPMYFYIDRQRGEFFTKNRVAFTLISAGLFFILLAYFYYIYGWEFLFETYLYHLTRKDNRHNFSVYFYYIYLNFEQVSIFQSVLSFIPQFSLVILSGYKYYRDLPFCCFMQTFWFVVFNKVCTAQYFIWYMSLLPLILARNRLFFKPLKFLTMWGMWLVFELLWNLSAYYLEHLGYNDFIWIWVASLLFFGMNVILGVKIMEEQEIAEFKILHEKTY
jgi:phosphatidylinositol glycan class M